MTLDVLTPVDAVVWPYLPDWSGGFNVRRSFATDIFDSRDDTEQRRAIRVDPRFSVDYRTKPRETEWREATRFLRTYQNRPVIVPDFARWARLTGDSASTDTTLTVSPMPAWAAQGQRLVLCGATTEDVLVESVAGTTITLSDPLAAAWATGSVLRPSFRGLLAGKTRAGRINKSAGDIAVSLDVYPGGEPPRETGTAWASVGSREVFTLEPDFASSPSVDYVWPVENVDFGRGRTAQFRPIDTFQNAFEAEFAGLGTATTAEVEQFFDRMKGRRNAFYMPTGDSDAVYVSSAASSVTVAGFDLVTQFADFDFATYEYGVSVCLTDGTDLYRRISGVTLSGSNSVIAVGTAWGTSLTSGNVARISLMPLVRFASDDMTTAWRTPLSSRIRLSFQSVRR